MKIDMRSKNDKTHFNYPYRLSNNYLLPISLPFIGVCVDNNNSYTYQLSRTVLETLNKLNRSHLNGTQIITHIVVFLKVTEAPDS